MRADLRCASFEVCFWGEYSRYAFEVFIQGVHLRCVFKVWFEVCIRGMHLKCAFEVRTRGILTYRWSQGHYMQEKGYTSCPHMSQHGHDHSSHAPHPQIANRYLCCCSCWCLIDSYPMPLLLAWLLLILGVTTHTTHTTPISFRPEYTFIYSGWSVLAWYTLPYTFTFRFPCAVIFKAGSLGHLFLGLQLDFLICHSRMLP